MGGRIRGFHRNDSGQILPLVFFFALAFFTGVVLLINTGRSVTDRIETQNAVDAANVSGVTTIARGMNYIARNNIAQSKILASIVIVRAIKPAEAAAQVILIIWDAVAVALDAAAAAAAASVVAAPAAPALKAAASVIRAKVRIERQILKVIKKAGTTLNKLWTKQAEDKGPAWTVLKLLGPFGKALMIITPVIAQTTAKIVYQKNVPGGARDPGLADLVNIKKPDMWLIPLFPNIPACKGVFADHSPPTTYYTGYYAKPVYLFGWITLTLSLFPVGYKAAIKAHLKKLFKGGDADEVEIDDPDAKRLDELQKELKRLSAEVEALEAERKTKVTQRDNKKKERKNKIAERDRHPTDSDEYKDLDKEVKELDKDIKKLQDDIDQIDRDIETKKKQMQADEKEIKKIQDDRTGGGTGPPDGWDDGTGDPLAGGSPARTDHDKKIFPYLLDARDYPKSFSYFAIGWQVIRDPVGGQLFKKKLEYGFTYAAAQLYNPTHADLWTADWRAKLVRATPSLLRNPLGTTIRTCAGQSTGDGGASQTGSSLNGDNRDTAEQSRSAIDKIIGILSKH